ncbi:hypothetical protein ABK040_015641 [Willaertia magna]
MLSFIVNKVIKPALHLLYVIIHFLLNPIIQSNYSTNIIYNCAWEDPELDAQVLDVKKDESNILIITSAGCNVLALALQNPKHIYSIDKNPCQNAVLELKLVAIRLLDYNTFWQLFGEGKVENFSTKLYPQVLRPSLSKEAREYWDQYAYYFDGKDWLFGLRNSFYYRSMAGWLAVLLIKIYCGIIPGLRKALDDLANAQTLEEQKRIYYGRVEGKLFNRVVMWILGSKLVLDAFNGVPEKQRNLILSEYATVGLFIKEKVGYICTQLPFKNNYFYKVYIKGHYDKDCCPEYLTEENFNRLKNEKLIDRISIHTKTITEYLIERRMENEKLNVKDPMTQFILLDHQDWLSGHPELLIEEWKEMLKQSDVGTKFMWRSTSWN